MALIRKEDGFKNQVLWVIPRKILTDLRAHPLLETLCLTDTGFFPDARYHYRKRSLGCDQHILIYCIEGNGFVETCRQQYTVRKNSVLLIPPGVAHVYGSLEGKEPWHIFWAHYTGSLAHHYNPGPQDNIYQSEVPLSKFPLLIQLFQSIFAVLDRGITPPNLVHISQTLGYLLSTLFFSASDPILSDHESGEVSGRHSQIVNNTILYMQEYITGSVTLDELAKRVGLSKSQLSLVFKEHTKYSPIDFFINLKMQRACRYLDLTDFSIQQVAASMGYKDPYYFSRLFAQNIGMAPSTYRNIKKG